MPMMSVRRTTASTSASTEFGVISDNLVADARAYRQTEQLNASQTSAITKDIGPQAGPLPTVVHLEPLLVLRQKATDKAWWVSTRHDGEDLVAQTGVVRTEPRQRLAQGHTTLDERVGLAGHRLSGTARCNEQPTEVGVGRRQ